MPKAQKVFLVSLFVVAAIFLFMSEAKSWRPRSATPHPRGTVPTAAGARARHHQYVRSHDFNHDGKVNTRDRLLWIRDHADGYSTVYITDDDADLIEIMDIDGDGDVELNEIQIFYKTYDSNKNGVLEDEEIDAAVD